MAATMKDVAKEAGVGIGTVSRVYNDSLQVNPDTKRKVLEAAKKLNFVPNVNGKRLRVHKTGVIAILVPVIDHAFFAKLIAEVEKAADQRGYSLLVVSSQGKEEKEKAILERIRRREVDGAIFVTHYPHSEEEVEGLSLVSIDRHLGKNVPIVTSDNYQATLRGIKVLYDGGCRKIAYLGSKADVDSEVSLRVEAYQKAMEDYGLPSMIVNDPIAHGEEKKAIDDLLAKYPDFDGLFVSGYGLAETFRRDYVSGLILDHKGVKLVSYDGEFDGLNLLTTLEQPLQEMAEKSVEVLSSLIEGKKSDKHLYVFPCALKQGLSTK